LNHKRAEKQKPIYIVPELTRIVRIVENHVPVKVRFSFIHESIAEIACFCSRCLSLLQSSYFSCGKLNTRVARETESTKPRKYN
jgi:hypothetical protein